MSRPSDAVRIYPAEKTLEIGRMIHTIADSGYAEGAPWTARQYEDSIRQEHVHYFVAEFDGEAVGFVGVGVVGMEAEIHSIAVSGNAKRQGVGYALLSHLTHWLSEKGVEELYLEVRESNAPAINLYRKSGFHIIGKRPNYYSLPTEDAYVMKKQL